ncbi:MAG: sulfotransferase family protein [Gaiellaceae bacterium]
MRVTRTPRQAALPNLITIGAMKCGTTSLHYYLDQHPDIAMSRRKELDFFSGASWNRGLDWYKAQFDPAAAIRGESSPSYTRHPRNTGVAGRMYSVIPDAKLIYLVRDPVARIVSHYLHNYSIGHEKRPIVEVLSDPNCYHYVEDSKYFLQLEQYLHFFACSRILVLTYDELLHDRAVTLRQVFEFLGVDSSFHDSKFERIRHRTGDRRRKTRLGTALATATRGVELPDWLSFQVQRLLPYPFSRRIERPEVKGALQERLARELEDDANRLRELTGKEFPGWCV